MSKNNIFSDDNNINEKAIIGFVSFLIMIIFAITDITMKYLGRDLIVNETIFNSFLTLTLSCFGIATLDKYINRSNNKPNNDPPTTE